MRRRRMIKDYSGRFLVRVPVTLHRTLAEQAIADRISLNQYVLFLLARGASLREFEDLLKSMKATKIQKMDRIVESERLAQTPKVKLRLIGLSMQELSIKKPDGKLYLEGELGIKVDEAQELLLVDGKEVTIQTTYTAKITSKDSGEKLLILAVLNTTYLGIRPISKDMASNLSDLRVSSYPGRIFRELLEKLIYTLNLNITIG
ncbi:toxin-antitoxin system HicB family antitoxin [candidate division WOR-3 bacterium]|uniref:Toxin-antitoxin system HicB family antitoxin n=1 Tax=candidate division WOR-3 bacterium TaxID=2052148 RepID=A0A9D5K936_UNCW3|nr:toxin-antitoxin system HicB family antitoxin [candidate division WOR-3 bacterium]MBD3364598.1 toxin-antitoxin system HicB family antitoxin [candidate division WOR-3 bacterium]